MIYVALLLFFFPMGYGKSSQFTSLNKRNHLKLFEAKQSQRIKKSQAHGQKVCWSSQKDTPEVFLPFVLPFLPAPSLLFSFFLDWEINAYSQK